MSTKTTVVKYIDTAMNDLKENAVEFNKHFPPPWTLIQITLPLNLFYALNQELIHFGSGGISVLKVHGVPVQTCLTSLSDSFDLVFHDLKQFRKINFKIKDLDAIIARNIIRDAVCECGSAKAGSQSHSHWCPKYKSTSL